MRYSGSTPLWAAKRLLLLRNCSCFIKKKITFFCGTGLWTICLQVSNYGSLKEEIALKSHCEQRYFRTEHMWWPHWLKRTSRCSVTWSTEVQISRLSKAFNSVFCKLQSRKRKVFIVNTYSFFKYFSTWDAATFTTNSIMVWVGFLWVLFCQGMPVVFWLKLLYPKHSEL